MVLNMLIRNDAWRVDPRAIYNSRVLFLACNACFGGLLFGMDLGMISGVLTLPMFQAKFGIAGQSKAAAATLSANIVSLMQAGAFFGALGAFVIVDRYGRKPGLAAVSVFTIAGVLLQSGANGDLAVFNSGRFVAGLGLGMATTVTPMYVSENAPRAIRGMMTGLFQLFETLGAMLAFWIDYGSLLHVQGNATWIVPIALQALPAGLLAVGLYWCTESPRYLAKQGDWEQAAVVLTQIRKLDRSHPYIQAELWEMSRQLEQERISLSGDGLKALFAEMWLLKTNRNRAFISTGLMICQQMTGTNAINYYAPTIFTALGVNGEANSLLATGVYGVCKVIGCSLFLLFMADALGRKKSLYLSATCMGIGMFYLGFYVRFSPPVANEPVPPSGYVALVMVYLFAIAFQLGWGPVCWIYVSEIPTARLRGANIALAAATQWLFNFVVARATPTMLATVGRAGYGTYFIYGSFCFAMLVFVRLCISETSGISLEAMDQLFSPVGLTDHDDLGKRAQRMQESKNGEAPHMEDIDI